MRLRLAMMLLAALAVGSAPAMAYDPGDVDGDGTVDAADLTCTVTTIWDPDAGCAVATQSPLRHVVRVSPSGGDYTSIQAALDDITASAGDGWLIEVGPGTYTEQVVMEPWVDIEGSGEGVTVISFTGSPSADTGAVVGADDAELRHVTVRNTGGGSAWAIGVYAGGTRPRLVHVRIEAFGATNNAGIYCQASCPRTFAVNSWGQASGGSGTAYGLYLDGSGSGEYDLEHVHLEGEGGGTAYGLYSVNGTVHLVHAKLVAYDADQAVGLHGRDSVVSAQRSMVIGEDAATTVGLSLEESGGEAMAFVVNSEIVVSSDVGGATTHPVVTDGGSTAMVGGSLLMGGTVSSSSTSCAGVYDESGTFYATTCP